MPESIKNAFDAARIYIARLGQVFESKNIHALDTVYISLLQILGAKVGYTLWNAELIDQWPRQIKIQRGNIQAKIGKMLQSLHSRY